MPKEQIDSISLEPNYAALTHVLSAREADSFIFERTRAGWRVEHLWSMRAVRMFPPNGSIV